MIMSKPEVIFFDVGYTLCYPKTGHWRFTKKFYESIDLRVLDGISQDRIEMALAKSNDYLLSNHRIDSQKEEYDQNIVAYTIISNELPELCLSEENIQCIAYDRTYNMQNYVFYDGIKELFQLLFPKYKLGVISDAWPSSVNMLKSAGIWEYLSTCTLSSDVGICKPNRPIYEKALQDMNVLPENCIFIDDVEENLITASYLGLVPIKIRTVDKSKSQFNTIDNILELKDILL